MLQSSGEIAAVVSCNEEYIMRIVTGTAVLVFNVPVSPVRAEENENNAPAKLVELSTNMRSSCGCAVRWNVNVND
jgi:hypothetical protein